MAGILARIKSLFAPRTPTVGVSILSGKSPLRRGKYELLENIEDYPILYAVLKKIAQNVASTEIKFFAVKEKGQFVRVPKIKLRNKEYRRTLRKSGEVVEITKHPVISLLEEGNEFMSGKQIIELTQMYLDLVGEAFWYLERNALDVPEKIYVIPPTWVKEIPRAENEPYKVLLEGTLRDIPPKDIIFFKHSSLRDPYGRGFGIAEVLRDELDVDEFASEHTKAWFYNRARPDLLITAPNLTREATERLERDWQEKLRGVFQWFKPYFLNADVKVHPLTQGFEEEKIVELRKFERDLILQTFGVPPEIVGIIENSNRATIEVADYIFAKRVLEPRLEFLIEILQEKLVPFFDERIIVDYAELTITDWDIKLEAGRIAPWSLTLNEWREILGYPPIEGGNLWMLPLNLIPTTRVEPGQEIPQKSSKPSRRKNLSEDDVYTILEAVDEWHISYKLHPIYKKVIEEVGQQTLDEMGMGLSFNLLDPRVVEFLDQKAGIYIKSIEEINATTIKYLRQTLIEGVRQGEGIPKLAERITRLFEEAEGYRAERIARTETIRAFNFAHLTAFSQAKIEYHQWIATRDDRVRDSHFATNGQVVKVGEPFTLGSGAQALYPGDPSLPPEECINCRCTIAAVIEGKSYLDTEEKRAKYWWEKEKRMEEYDKLFMKNIREAFRLQREAVLRRLYEIGG